MYDMLSVWKKYNQCDYKLIQRPNWKHMKIEEVKSMVDSSVGDFLSVCLFWWIWQEGEKVNQNPSGSREVHAVWLKTSCKTQLEEAHEKIKVRLHWRFHLCLFVLMEMTRGWQCQQVNQGLSGFSITTTSVTKNFLQDLTWGSTRRRYR